MRTISEQRESEEELNLPPLRFILTASDNQVYEWTQNDKDKYSHHVAAVLEELIPDVAWSPNVLNYETFAACDRNGNVQVYQRSKSEGKWELA